MEDRGPRSVLRIIKELFSFFHTFLECIPRPTLRGLSNLNTDRRTRGIEHAQVGSANSDLCNELWRESQSSSSVARCRAECAFPCTSYLWLCAWLSRNAGGLDPTNTLPCLCGEEKRR